MDLDYSVGIPVRNEERTIGYTLESVLKQTILPNKIYVCVNGSTDRTYKVISDFLSNENSVELLKSSPGKANAWHEIINHSVTDKIMFCDGDVKLNNSAAENLLKTFEEENNLILVGGSNAYKKSNGNTFFSKYFAENLDENIIKQSWVCGRLYMIKLNELKKLAEKLKIELMPRDIINEDGYLEMISKGYKKIIDSSYNLSTQVNSFSDWLIGYKRVLAGQRQLSKRYPEYFGETDFSLNRLNNYYERFKKINSFGKKLGVTSLFALRQILNLYYKFFDNLDYSLTWKETKSTKML